MSELAPCGSCRRHVRLESKACPFCKAAIVAAIVFMPALARADEREPKPLYGLPPPPHEKHANAVQADLGLAVVGLAYERVLNPSVAIQLEGHVFGTWWGPTFDLPHFKGAGAQIRPTFFVSGEAPRGMYVAPFVRGAAVSASKDGHTGHGFGWSAGTFVGYSWVFGQSVNLRIGGGAQYMHYAVDAGPHRIEWKRLYPALDLVVGYTF